MSDKADDTSFPIRAKLVIFNACRQPTTKIFCCMCQRDVKPDHPCRWVYLTSQMNAVHPADLHLRTPKADDLGWQRIGIECARKLGDEWTVDRPRIE